MANDEHVEWLLEGVDKWNERRVNGEVWDPDFSGADLMTRFRLAGKVQKNVGVQLIGPNLDGIDLTSANLSGVKLNHASLKNAKLTGANLRNGLFPGSSFVDANLNDADLSGSNLGGADFQKAKLQKARLTEADLRNAKLQNANLDGAILTNSILDFAKLHGTNLLGAVLTDTSLEGTELLSAHLFGLVAGWPEHEMWKPENENGLTVNSVEELLGIVRKVKKHYESFSSDVFLYFRGDGRCDWDLCPSIMRTIQEPTPPPISDDAIAGGNVNFLNNLDPDELLDYAQFRQDFRRWFARQGGDLAPRAFERDMLVELMARRPDEFSSMPSALAQWMLAQHHGLQTRFLDVTKNLLVAAHFACSRDTRRDGRVHIFALPKQLVRPFNSDAISVVANIAKLQQHYQNVLLNKPTHSSDAPTDSQVDYGEALRLLYQLIREEKPNFERRIDPRDFYRVFVVEPQQLSERLRAQSGAFLVSAFHENFQREEVLASNAGIPIYDYYSIIIPSAAKANFLHDLPVMDTTTEKLFPGLDSSAAAVLNEFGLRSPPIPGQRQPTTQHHPTPI